MERNISRDANCRLKTRRLLYFFSLHIYFYSIRISNHVKICDLNLQCLLVNLWISTECSVGNGCIMSRLRWFISFVAVFRCPLISLITLRIYLVSVSISICLFQQIWLDIKPLKISLSKTESTRYIFFGHYSSYRAVYIYLFLTLRVETAIWLSPAVIKIVPKGEIKSVYIIRREKLSCQRWYVWRKIARAHARYVLSGLLWYHY